ncbi:MAG: hypothetical protein ACUVWX_11875 [Kiritimatiellia bacterium]
MGVALVIADLSLLLFALVAPGVLKVTVGLAEEQVFSAIVIFLVTGFAAGVLTGIPFPLAGAWKVAEGEPFARAGGYYRLLT